jgi:hypothetical protein
VACRVGEVQKIVDEFVPETHRKEASRGLAHLLRRHAAEAAELTEPHG